MPRPRSRLFNAPCDMTTSAALDRDAIVLDDAQLTRELRSIARSIARLDPEREERVAATLLRLACLRGLPSVRLDLDATVKRGTGSDDDNHQEHDS